MYLYPRDGAQRSGLFCVLANLVEQLQLSVSVDILQTVLNIRHRRPQIVPCLVIACVRLSCMLNIHVNVMMQSDINIYHKYSMLVILSNCL